MKPKDLEVGTWSWLGPVLLNKLVFFHNFEANIEKRTFKLLNPTQPSDRIGLHEGDVVCFLWKSYFVAGKVEKRSEPFLHTQTYRHIKSYKERCYPVTFC